MRCSICDYCPTAPSLSSPQEKAGIPLFWDAEIKGWHCRGTCDGSDHFVDDYIEIELPEGYVETNRSQAPVSLREVK